MQRMHIPEAFIIPFSVMFRFFPTISEEAESKERTRDLIHLTGPIPDLLDGAMPWIARNTPTSIRCDDLGNSREIPILPMWAVRELLVNALVHRNLDAATKTERRAGAGPSAWRTRRRPRCRAGRRVSFRLTNHVPL